MNKEVTQHHQTFDSLKHKQDGGVEFWTARELQAVPDYSRWGKFEPIINKFNTASKQPECYNPSDKLIVLIDEGHRSQGGENHERMRKALPNAAYIASTGTPLLKNDKTTNKFGPIIHAYTMQRAVEDGTVTPLLYEERQPDLAVNEKAIDSWFDKITAALSEEQRADLKKKFARKGPVYKSQNRIELIAWDIAVHFNENIKKVNHGLKAQVACDSKLSAIRYKKYLDETGLVSSAVVISPPDIPARGIKISMRRSCRKCSNGGKRMQATMPMGMSDPCWMIFPPQVLPTC